MYYHRCFLFSSSSFFFFFFLLLSSSPSIDDGAVFVGKEVPNGVGGAGRSSATLPTDHKALFDALFDPRFTFETHTEETHGIAAITHRNQATRLEDATAHRRKRRWRASQALEFARVPVKNCNG